MQNLQVDNVKISILMSVHNEKDTYLKRCIDSMLAQSFRDFEFIIVADGTSDENINTLLNYKKQDHRIKLIINEKNIGLTKSLNLAFDHSVAPYLCRIDSDDFSKRTRLSEQFTFLKSNPNFSVCGTKSSEIINGITELQHTQFHQTNEEIQKAIYYMNPMTHSTLMISRSAFLEINGYDSQFKYAQDYDLICRLLKLGKAFNLPVSLVTRSMDDDRISSKKKSKQLYYSIQIRYNLLKEGEGGLKNKAKCAASLLKSLVKYFLLKLHLFN